MPLPDNTATPTQTKTGRPHSLTPESLKRITDAIRLGSTYKLAAQYGGISYISLNSWLKRGAIAQALKENGEIVPENEQMYLDLLNAVEKAEADAFVGWLAKIEKEANEGTWQAAAWKLERRYPKEFGRSVVTNEIVGPDDGPVQVKFYIPDNGRNDRERAK